MEHDTHGLIDDVFAMHQIEEPLSSDVESNPQAGENNNKFHQLVKENDQMLYPNCKKYSKLSFVIHLYHLKCLHGWSDKSFSMLLELLSDALPEGNIQRKS
ncbi:unnamed protein product [Lupinus luteus]|uniref:Uncharacterized protein n=1 Tax=Lupinus luteus TaxID=3873 RepID=A0AAV1X5J6_LUPLU